LKDKGRLLAEQVSWGFGGRRGKIKVKDECFLAFRGNVFDALGYANLESVVEMWSANKS
jgi:hypothetical protein